MVFLWWGVHFYPRSPCGERLHYDNYNLHCVEISIHALLAESDFTTTIIICIALRFLSTLSLRRATHYDNYNLHCVEISIHALLAESDNQQCKHHPDREISIHALLAESDTPLTSRITRRQYFYPRSPCGERPHYDNYNLHCVEISIHALLAESDMRHLRLCDVKLNFYPRSPCGERHNKPTQHAG